MKTFFELLLSNPLFQGICEGEVKEALTCLQAVPQPYSAGENIFLAGQKAERVGIVLEGLAQVVWEDFSGGRTILAALEPGEMFGEAFAFAKGPNNALPVWVTAQTECTVLLFSVKNLVAPPAGCPYQQRLVENMLGVLASKNLLLNQRLRLLSKRTTKEKVLAYLAAQAAAQVGGRVVIPFNRQELADYLCVDRSALSAVLGQLRREGALRFHKNHFELLDEPEGL